VGQIQPAKPFHLACKAISPGRKDILPVILKICISTNLLILQNAIHPETITLYSLWPLDGQKSSETTAIKQKKEG